MIRWKSRGEKDWQCRRERERSVFEQLSRFGRLQWKGDFVAVAEKADLVPRVAPSSCASKTPLSVPSKTPS